MLVYALVFPARWPFRLLALGTSAGVTIITWTLVNIALRALEVSSARFAAGGAAMVAFVAMTEAWLWRFRRNDASSDD